MMLVTFCYLLSDCLRQIPPLLAVHRQSGPTPGPTTLPSMPEVDSSMFGSGDALLLRPRGLRFTKLPYDAKAESRLQTQGYTQQDMYS